jgi:hypothetical protein
LISIDSYEVSVIEKLEQLIGSFVGVESFNYGRILQEDGRLDDVTDHYIKIESFDGWTRLPFSGHSRITRIYLDGSVIYSDGTFQPKQEERDD